MSISDRLMLDWFDALSAGEWSDLQEERARLAGEAGDPHAFKHALARRVVERFHGAPGAAQAAEHFRRTVQEREAPADLPETALELGEGGVLGLLEILERVGLTPSRSEARRLIGQGAVTIDGAPVADPALRLARGVYQIKVGKRRFAQDSTALSARLPRRRARPRGAGWLGAPSGEPLPLTRVGDSRRFRPPRDQKQPARFRLRVAGSSEGLGTGPQGLRSVFEN